MGPLFSFSSLSLVFAVQLICCRVLNLDPLLPSFLLPLDVPMDTGRLPAYRSSYLLRFHPYPRMKPSVRETIMASTRGDEYYELLQMSLLRPESDISFALSQAIHGAEVRNEIQRQRRLSMSSLVVDLALLSRKRLS